ncbi:CPBP family intramembrane glutamic endopeptidase [Streptomonospora litoralis]|uniref:CAAX amino terminal protease self-immunity n=1 Tax=Streptomonospora litoralis TaxID=2498135 RepID=A0A4P6PX86_9ACTN|nr:CPBP family intramembrane glutamic endopeptidase [Streptomonospora litoralis]QBI52808.1 CAAX amino terminal protease self- immunity [Streptomonospora litoralis]
MLWTESIPQFGVVAGALAFLLVGYAAAGEPLLGWRAFARLRRRRDSDPGALARFYRLAMGVHLAWVAAVVVILLVAPGVTPAHVGLRAPVNWGPLLAAVLGFCLALLIVWLITRGRNRSGSGAAPLPSVPDPGEGLSVLAPRNRRERRLAGALAVTAGVSEELLYRGLLVAFGVALGLPVWAAAVAACVLFALAHLYQGWWGLVGPGLLGALFMVVYLGTGSLLFPIVLHVVLELRSLLLTGSGRRHRARAL